MQKKEFYNNSLKEKIKSFIFSISVWVLAAGSLLAQDTKSIYSNIPSIEQIGGQWVSTDTVASNPSLRNFRGQALVNRDINSVSWLAAAPYSGGYHTGRLKVNGKVPVVNKFRWLPYKALRKASIKHWKLSSITSMPSNKNAILWTINVTNKSQRERELTLSLDLIGFISKYGGTWQWPYPYPALNGKTTKRTWGSDSEIINVRRYTPSSFDGTLPDPEKASFPSDKKILDSKKYSATTKGNKVFITDHETPAKSAFRILGSPWQISAHHSGATAKKSISVKPGQTYTIKYMMVFGTKQNRLNASLENIGNSFDQVMEQNKNQWHEKWQQIFRPDNEVLSGTFPVLATKDSAAKQVYYTGALTMLYLMNTHLPRNKIDFLTGGPKWGATTTFWWDKALWSTLWAVTAPDLMKNYITSWIRLDPDKYYGQDNFSGKGSGNKYSANYWALFSSIHAYVTVTKDYDYLKKKVNGKTVLQHLEAYALNWKKLAIYEEDGHTKDVYKLADFGPNPINLLEAVPTYIHIVPSFNASYVWMMRQVAALHTKMGHSERADSLLTEARNMARRILKLYAGNGVWYALYPNGEKVTVRHVMDFLYLGSYIPKDIPDSVKKEMVNFVYQELKTPHWMRAQSLQDSAADRSQRPDHGPLGAFDGWIGGTMDALAQLGYPDKALKFYHDIAPVTKEGIWSQAHELWGKHKRDKNAQVRIGQRGWTVREATAGINISQVMLKNFFGFYPEVSGKVLHQSWSPANFQGTLFNVKYGGKYYMLEAQNGRVTRKAQHTPSE